MGFSTDDTIVAIATPPGRGGLGVVRISGPDAQRVGTRLTGLSRCEPRHATLVNVAAATLHDQAIATFFSRPASYTGEDVLEISAHGSPVVLRSIVRAAIDAGARLAEPGEFTLRAYLHGRLDLVQAEAVADLIDAVTPLQARAAFDQLDGTLTTHIRGVDEALFDLSARLEASLDFPEEGYHFVESGRVAAEVRQVVERVASLLDHAARGRLLREGARVAIVGRPNAGKSTLFNALAGADRAIVTEIPGTTRDLVTEVIDVDGVPVTLVDTAGLRAQAADPVEHKGIERTRGAAAVADLLIVVLDTSRPLDAEDEALLHETSQRRRVVVLTKGDLAPAWTAPLFLSDHVLVSVHDGRGLLELRAKVLEALGDSSAHTDAPALTNLRHVTLLERAQAALLRAEAAALENAPEEFVAADIAEARQLLEEITGRRTAEDTLAAIFSRFCIGK
jgi:tRNA modification GTPase